MDFLAVGNKRSNESEVSEDNEEAINGDSNENSKGLGKAGSSSWMKLMEGFNPAILLSLSSCSGEESDSSKNLLCQQSGFGSAIAVLAQSHLERVCPLKRPVGPAVPEKQSRVSAQLTIFYGGTVNVYDDISADKAQAIMLLASSGNHGGFGSQSPPEKSVSLAVYNQPARKISDLPIARKQSLQRFLEKRQDRRQAKTPYAIDENAKPKPSPSPPPISSSPTLQAT
ncbi:hypothetical protein SUGI_0126580 [Cryptomeria japonica]|uniref:protein TIFY 10B n=1 Tax=Cryptomeria japonica TaxID=3369 RepID=UPI002408A313|nr:protein TIFY 10B [Cryptomeria japonica]GLJ10346.1 hypothetical protein SUGI_0126580 [Cryptomeria japonica]